MTKCKMELMKKGCSVGHPFPAGWALGRAGAGRDGTIGPDAGYQSRSTHSVCPSSHFHLLPVAGGADSRN